MAELFWNRDEQRLRAGIRMLVYFALWGFGPAALHSILGNVLRNAAPADWQWLVGIVADLLRLAAVLAATVIAARWIDRRPLQSYGLRIDRRWLGDLVFGALLGAVLMVGVFVVGWLADWYAIADVWVSAPATMPFVLTIWAPITWFAVIAIAEELLCRSNQLLNLAEGWQPSGRLVAVTLAWLVSSAIFALLHVYNPHSNWYTTLCLLGYGLFFGLGYVLTGQIALPIGLHFTWNFVQGNIFGFPVSGRITHATSLFVTQESGPDLWTGGAFGPEAGLLGLLAALVGAGVIVLWARWRYGGVGYAHFYACVRETGIERLGD